MGFFNRSSRAGRLLPPDLGRMLAEYGQFEFDARSAPMPSNDTVSLMSRLPGDSEIKARSADAVTEIAEAANTTGGWATYGAPAFIDAFLPMESGSPTYEALYEARLHYLRGLGYSELSPWLNINDKVRWKQMFPDEL